ncbi:gamma carbonic anhydrase family protein [candidate division KSB1 bacterium]
MPIIKPYKNIHPNIADDVFVAENAVIIGDVGIGPGSGVWYNTVIRGDVHYIRIGERTSIQDGSILHVTGEKFPLNIGNDVVIGHGAIVHGCTIEDNAMIGIGACVLDGAKISPYSIVAAGSVVREGLEVPPGVMLAGVPAKIKRPVTDEEREMIEVIAKKYVGYAAYYRTVM